MHYDNDFEDEYESYGATHPQGTNAPGATHDQNDMGPGGGGEVEMTAAHNAFVKALVRRGVMGRLRAQLRSSVVGIIMNNPMLVENNIAPKGIHLREGGAAAPLTPEKQHALAMCVEFLSSMGYEYSLGVLLEESNFAGATADLIARGFESNADGESDAQKQHELAEFNEQKSGVCAVTETTWDRAVYQMRRELQVASTGATALESLLSMNHCTNDNHLQSMGEVNSAEHSHSGMSASTKTPTTTPLGAPLRVGVGKVNATAAFTNPVGEVAIPSPTKSADHPQIISSGSASPTIAGSSLHSTFFNGVTATTAEDVSSVDNSDHSPQSINADREQDDDFDTVIEVPMSAAQSPAPKTAEQRPPSAHSGTAAAPTPSRSSSSSSSAAGDDAYEDDYEDSVEDEDAF